MANVRGAKALGVKVEGLDELEKQFKNLGVDFPKRNIRRASNKGMKAPLKVARQLAPEQSGTLKKGLIKREEKVPRKKKKAVYYLDFDPAKTNIFRKKISEAGRGMYGGKKPTAYYPISQEYGFLGEGGKIIPKDAHYIERAIEQTQEGSLKTIIDDLLKSINQISKKVKK